jgi:hypothetical protein
MHATRKFSFWAVDFESDIKLVMRMLGVESGGYRCRCRHEQVVDVFAHGGKLVSILSSLVIPLQINVTAKLTPLI